MNRSAEGDSGHGLVDAAPLREAGLDPRAVEAVVEAALQEDLAGGVDVTSIATVPGEQRAVLEFVARSPGVVAGLPVAAAAVRIACGPGVSVVSVAADGDNVEAGDVLMTATGPTRSLMLVERTALNLLCHLSGVATATSRWVSAVAGTGAHVRDTRKTTPGLRALQKYAVRCGGGMNHRMSLSDAALVKDNHVVAAGGVAEAFEAVRRRFPAVPVEVEVDSVDQLLEVLAAGADRVLLDNFTVEQMRTAVEINAGRAMLEASGGLTLDQAAAVAATGVDYLAVGAITHSAAALDIGADLRVLPPEDAQDGSG
ncbi:MAG: carboxylating nicotinate-nucleotide diphosphorylase [Candidatus Nanopelagicales bacterium]|nr:carboxylating nicotinate-nucleotide diphosphorylase [Candidatus Nanopelagicales bacterium]MDZ4249718.1 carboxylating nicotinate-nucleotide diphosphorylase [Candidatus Nanopelagicales bacterium]